MPKTPLTLSQAVDAYLSRYGNKQTVKTKRRDLNQLCRILNGDWLLSEITWMEMNRYEGKIKSDCPDPPKWCGRYAPKSVRAKLKSVRTFFKWAHKKKLIGENPTDDFDIPPEPIKRTRESAFSADEVKMLIAWAEGDVADVNGERRRRLRDLALLLLCHDTGMRVGTLQALQVQDFDLERQMARAFNTKIKGGGRHYYVQYSAYTARVLREWFGKLPDDPAAYIWATRNKGRRMTRESISQIIGRACDAVGIPRRAAHAMRHHAAHRMADAGANPVDISNVLDNTPEVVAQYYIPHDQETAFRKNAATFLPDPQAKRDDRTIDFEDARKSS